MPTSTLISSNGYTFQILLRNPIQSFLSVSLLIVACPLVSFLVAHVEINVLKRIGAYKWITVSYC